MQSHLNIGRNDPCWCGSGKKYKHCHFRQDQSRLAEIAANNRLSHQLTEFAMKPQFKAQAEQAFKQFFPADFEFEEDDDDEQLNAMQKLLDYFVHDFRLPDGKRVIERYIADEGRRITVGDRVRLNDMLDSRLSIFEIVELRAGEGMRLRDVLSGELFEVTERRATLQLRRWEVLFARIFRAGDHYEIGAHAVPLLSSHRDPAHRYMEELHSAYVAEHPDATYVEFLHAGSHLLNQYVVAEIESLRAQPPTTVTPEGDLMEIWSATFDVRDHARALNGLRTAAEFNAHPDDEPDTATFTWIEAGESLELLRLFGPAFEYKPPQGSAQGGVRQLGTVGLAASG